MLGGNTVYSAPGVCSDMFSHLLKDLLFRPLRLVKCCNKDIAVAHMDPDPCDWHIFTYIFSSLILMGSIPMDPFLETMEKHRPGQTCHTHG